MLDIPCLLFMRKLSSNLRWQKRLLMQESIVEQMLKFCLVLHEVLNERHLVGFMVLTPIFTHFIALL